MTIVDPFVYREIREIHYISYDKYMGIDPSIIYSKKNEFNRLFSLLKSYNNNVYTLDYIRLRLIAFMNRRCIHDMFNVSMKSYIS